MTGAELLRDYVEAVRQLLDLVHRRRRASIAPVAPSGEELPLSWGRCRHMRVVGFRGAQSQTFP